MLRLSRQSVCGTGWLRHTGSIFTETTGRTEKYRRSPGFIRDAGPARNTRRVLSKRGAGGGVVATVAVEKIPTKVILDGLKRNMSRGTSLSDELDFSSVLGDTRSYLYSLVLG